MFNFCAFKPLPSFLSNMTYAIVNDSVIKCKPSAVPAKTNEAYLMIYLIINKIYYCGRTY